jgi:crotonobetainyl-CoA:carnitine CoA-transferase CaiB-like acyl-CoA transferase
VIARISGFGQIGPYARRPGFGTPAEAMSGFAAATGEPDGPPTLPPFGLADTVTALATAYAVMRALRGRELTGAGQVVDLATIEPIMAMLGPQITWYDQLGYVQPRLGNRSNNNAPRNTYRCADAGSRSRVVRRALPSGCCGWWGGRSWPYVWRFAVANSNVGLLQGVRGGARRVRAPTRGCL